MGSRYVIRRPLGFGGICTVHEAVHLFSARRVAVKMLNPEYAAHAEARYRLLDEARALGMVRHPNVVEIHDAGVWNDAPYVVMELLEGRNLEGLITSRGKLSPNDTVSIARQVALGLGAAHDVGLVHRDMKPGNVVIVQTPLGREGAMIIDFGVARLPRGTDRTSSHVGSRDTVVGTLEYMSPEQLTAREELDCRTDIFALGVMMWECLTEVVPLTGTHQEMIASYATTALPSLRRARPDLPQPLIDVVDRCLARDPRDRFRDVHALVHALDATGLGRLPTFLLGAPAGDLPLPLATPQIDARAPVADPSAEQAAILAAQEAARQEANRRQNPRANFNSPVRVTTATGTVDMNARDISEGGLLVIGPRGMVVGQSAQLRFALPTTGDMVLTPAVVRWVRDRPGSSRAPCAVGFQFTDPSPALKSAVLSYLSIMNRG